jgi:hypothetical protein
MRPSISPIVAAVVIACVSAGAGQHAPAKKDPAPPIKAAAAQPAQPAAQADPLPTVETIQKALKDNDAPEALKQVNRLLSLRGKAAEALDKYELLSLKGEAHLRLKASEAAAASFRQAAAATQDPQQQAVARATEVLIKRSKQLAYTPKKVAKGDKAEPIDVVEPESRQKALSALFVDEVAPLLPKVDAAKSATSVAPMIKLMQAAREVEFLERAANGSADQVGGIVEKLGEQGRSMLAKVVERATKRVDRITTLANEMEQVQQVIPLSNGGYQRVLIPRRRGIKNDDVTELQGFIDALDEVVAQSKALSQSQGKGADEAEQLTDSAADLKVHVQRMLRVHNVDYAGRRDS